MNKLGFSDSFSCCSHWQHCLQGIDTCYYESIDPEVKDGCHCYQRNHGIVKISVQENDLFTLGEESPSEKQKDEFSYGENGQLSLF